ncbi:histidine acid phosphatase family protein [Stylonychia lemnae]|uniref:Histidine acid phosphatase family protein n=1 Tax=Stylonychia lemnae TaxID=5949 RepID=A0A078AY41_STYLE|nr:histidine acid phosphatase family protein [Stylonychia lemnae]|eukprot:CDW87084.1 histidine acid phosphatase family protein [Stylonychia lemnae]
MTLLYFILSILQSLVLPKLVHVLQMQRHGIAASTSNLMKEYYPNGLISLTTSGMRMMYLSGIYFRQRYIENPNYSGFIDDNLIDKQIGISNSDVIRTVQSSQAFYQGLVINNSQSLQLKTHHRKSISQSRSSSPIQVEMHHDEKTQDDIEKILSEYNPMFSRTFSRAQKDKVNTFSCKILTEMHFYLQTYQSELYAWPRVYEHFRSTGIYKVMAERLEISEEVLKLSGFQFVYTQAVLLSSLKRQFDFQEIDVQPLSYSEWNTIESIITTHQYGVFSQWMIDLQNMRLMQLFIRQLDKKVNCILSKSLYQCREMMQYEIFIYHDLNLLAVMKLLNFEQQYKYTQYSSAVLFELHFDQNQHKRGYCRGLDCFHIKIYINEDQIFTELPFCDYQTQKCKYTQFIQYVESRYIKDIDTDKICNEQFDPMRLIRHKAHII